MASQPLYVLARISLRDDAMQIWRIGDRYMMNRLAKMKLMRDGLRMPVIAAADVTDAGLAAARRAGGTVLWPAAVSSLIITYTARCRANCRPARIR